MPVLKTRSGVHLFFDLTGPADAPIVAFSNSLGTTIEMWDRQAEALSGRYRVLRYDTRGHGRSEVIDQHTSVEVLADDLAELMDGLHIAKAHIVGLSLGGMTAQVMGFRHREKVSSLVLMATAARMPVPDLWNQRIATARNAGLADLAEQSMGRWFTPEGRAREAATVAAMRDRFVAVAPAGYAVACAAIRDMDLRSELPKIAAPTLVIAGAKDPATPPKDGEEIASLVPGAEFVVVPNAAHILNVEQTLITNRHLIAWLDGQAAAPVRRAGGKTFEEGLGNRKAVLGVEHVERSLANAGPFASPWQDFITRYAWGEIWGDPTLPRKTRSMLVLTTCIALGKEEEFKLHVRPALRNGVSLAELRAVLMQAAIYAGVPAANGAFRWAREVLGAELDAAPAG
jgi:3-oxoadipate enol-lactonase/4-carboxymuconolactone decarboxylase